jgi:phosphoglycerate kinase
MSTLRSINDVVVTGKRVLIRVDFNVPMKNGVITDDTRIRETLPTLRQLLASKAKVFVVSHFGRPVPGKDNAEFTLLPVANKLKELLQYPVHFAAEWLQGVDCKAGELVVCENVRFLAGETENDENLSRTLASLCDIFVMDAFACAHRAHASTEGIAHFAPIAVAGPLLLKEIEALDKVLNNTNKPTVAIVGGSKVSTKLTILEQLINKVDILIVGGGIANTFLAAKGYNVGASLYERDLLNTAKKLLANNKCQILLPQDAVVANEITEQAVSTVKIITEINENDKILDIGSETIELYAEQLQKANTILWNGPVGVFEYESFANGTKQLAQAIAKSKAYSVAGGGDTIAAIKQFKVEEEISYISTGGGAFLEYIEGIILPGIGVLQQGWYK